MRDHDTASFSDRLNKACDWADIPKKGHGRQRTLADLVGVSQKGARKWLEGETKPKLLRVDELAGRLGVRRDWLLFGEGGMTDADPSDPSGAFTPSIPLMTPLRPGRLGVICCRSDARIHLPPHLRGQSPKDAFGIVAGDSSMAPTIHKGDTLIVAPSLKAEPGDIVIYQHPDSDEFVIRTLRQKANGYELSPASSDYATITESASLRFDALIPAIEHWRAAQRVLRPR